MEEKLFLLVRLIYLSLFLYLLDFWNQDTDASSFDSETHARNRYSVAEDIQREFDKR